MVVMAKQKKLRNGGSSLSHFPIQRPVYHHQCYIIKKIIVKAVASAAVAARDDNVWGVFTVGT